MHSVIFFLLLTIISPCYSRNCFVGSNYQVSAASIDSGTLSSQPTPNGTNYCVRIEGTATVTLFDIETNMAGKQNLNNW